LCKDIIIVRERKNLINSFNQTKSEIEKLRNSLQQIGDQKSWFIWIETFGNDISEKRHLPDPLKKVLLEQVLDCITVDYDWVEKVHRLNISFKIPVFTVDGGDKYSPNIRVPSGTLGNQENQLMSRTTYSTVTGTHSKGNQSSVSKISNISTSTKGYSLRMSVELTSSNLWTSTYSSHQQRIFDVIRKLHVEDGWNFKQISSWLNDNGYLSTRGKVFRENHVWSIYMKKLRSLERFGREFQHKITEMKVDVVDYVPTV